MVLPAHILLPPPREVARPGQPGPARVPAGTIVVGRVLAAAGGAPAATPDGRAAVRTQFPQGVVLIPTEDRLAAGTQVFAQVREEQGQTLLGLLDGAGRGTLFRGPATEAAPAGAQTTILLNGAPASVETAAPVQVGEPVIAQLQPRGSRAALRALPASLNQATPPTGVVESAEGPLLTVRVEGVQVLAVPRGEFTPGDVVQLRLDTTPAGLQVVATVPAHETGAAGVGTAAAASAEVPPGAPPAPFAEADALLQTLRVPVTPVTRAAAVALLRLVAAAPAPPAETGAPATAPPATPIATTPSASPAFPAAAAPPALTPFDVEATVALQMLGEPVEAENLAAASALLRAEVAVTPQSLQAARVLLTYDAPISARTISTATALLDIVVPPQPQTVESLAGVLFDPSTLVADLTALRDTVVQLTPNLPGDLQPVFAEVARGLVGVLVDLAGGPPDGAQIAAATRFSGLQTEQLLGALIEIVDHSAASAAAAPGTAAAANDPAVMQAAATAARDVRVLLGRLQTVVREAGSDGPLPAETRAAIEAGAGRVIDRLQGLQLQNLRAPVTQHLTLEVPVAGDGELHHVQVRVYYRAEDEGGGGVKRTIDERNTTIAVRLATSKLGRVNATVAIADGRLTTDFRVESPGVADHLLDGSPELRAGLEAIGYNVARIGATAPRPARKLEPEAIPRERLGPDGIDIRI